MTRVSRLLPRAALAAIVPFAAAQDVSPEHFAAAEAPRNLTGPFGQNSSTGWRHLQVHDDLTGAPRTFRSLAIRRDAAAQGPYNAYSLRLTLILSKAATTSDTLDATFDANHGPDRITVVNDRTITFPSTAATGGPAPFDYVVPFDVPYSWNGTGSLCWEVRVQSSTNMLTTYTFDAVSDASSNPALAVATFGFGCRHSSRVQPMSATGSSSMNWTTGVGTLTLDGSELPESSPVTVLLGFSKTAMGALPLPFLLPGSMTAPSGACALFTSADAAFGITTTGTSVRFSLPVPAAVGLHGTQTYTQFLAADPNAGHPLGVALSNCVQHGWVEPFNAVPVGHVQSTNLFGATGTVRARSGYVVELR